MARTPYLQFLMALALTAITGGSAFAQSAEPVDPLEGLNKAVETMVQRVSPSIVQVLVSKFDLERRIGTGTRNQLKTAF